MNEDIRNIAIIAHVDHGKTTLVDALLRQAKTNIKDEVLNTECIMDSNEIEKERGITIFAKNASVRYGNTKINILDTPGHADFGGEVERVLTMADAALLLIDAKEGPMPQTRFVLKKALQLGLKIIVVINKMDKPEARPAYVLDEALNLFIELGANDAQLDFPVIYSISKQGKAGMKPDVSEMKDITPIFETILKFVPPAERDVDANLQFLTVNISRDDFKGRIATGKIYKGKIKSGETVSCIGRDGKAVNFKVTALMVSDGLGRVEVCEAGAGDIVHIAGYPDIGIGDTISSKDNPVALTRLKIDEPTIQVVFMVNNSPFAGREGTYVTSRQLRERLYKEMETDVALRVEDTNFPEKFLVSGRGELHIGILIERMRREGYEFQVGRPKVIYKDIDGVKNEPYEEVSIEVPDNFAGTIIEKMGTRGAEMKDMRLHEGITHLTFIIPTSRFLGFRSKFMTDTKGLGILNSLFYGYLPAVEARPQPHGSVVAYEDGQTTAFALENAQLRGTMFVPPGVQVYRGQVVGRCSRDEDLEINVCKKKELSNMRSTSSDGMVMLDPHVEMGVEDALEYISDDELVEVTPKSVRMRSLKVFKTKGH
ncbi:MAG TPA: translational GTPase TypA [Candidatus Paceibacterota bacterium]|nr:translational GTPase TypA [Candidatus Paceibacterota bacterium]